MTNKSKESTVSSKVDSHTSYGTRPAFRRMETTLVEKRKEQRELIKKDRKKRDKFISKYEKKCPRLENLGGKQIHLHLKDEDANEFQDTIITLMR